MGWKRQSLDAGGSVRFGLVRLATENWRLASDKTLQLIVIPEKDGNYY